MSDADGHWLCTGTLMRTPAGDLPIETLAVGDLVITLEGVALPICGLSSRLIDCEWHPDAMRFMPIRVAAHAFGANEPSRELFVSREQPVAIDFVARTIVPIASLINGATIERVHANTVAYWRIELDRQSLLIAEDMPVLTHGKSIGRGRIAAGLLDLHTCETHPAGLRECDTVLDMLRSRLRTQALSLGWTLDDGPLANLRLTVGGAAIEPSVEALTAFFRVPGGARNVHLVCETTSPHGIGLGADGRELGIRLRGLAIGEEGQERWRTLALDDPLLCIGFFQAETNGIRWTTGRARLPDALWQDHPSGCTLRVDLAGPCLPRWKAPASVEKVPVGTVQSRRAPARTPRPTQTILYWCDETIRQPFETGVQRVTRRLGRGLETHDIDVVPVGWDWRRRAIVTIGGAEHPSGLTPDELPLSEAMRPWLFMPELSLSLADAGLDPLQLARAHGFRTAALLHDVIPLKLPHLYDADFIRRFRRYFGLFASANLVVVGTNYVAGDLRAQLERIGAVAPEIAVVPFAAQLGDQPRRSSRKPARVAGAPLRLLTISTFEPRKNLPRLLEAIRRAEAKSNTKIELAVVGQRVGASAYEAEIAALCATMPGVTLHPPVDDDRLAKMFESCDASVYPSCEEGYGLPIVESLWLATPSICHHASAMAEIARGGGVLTVDMSDADAIARVLVDVGSDDTALPRLSEQALARPLASWSTYAAEVYARLGAATAA